MIIIKNYNKVAMFLGLDYDTLRSSLIKSPGFKLNIFRITPLVLKKYYALSSSVDGSFAAEKPSILDDGKAVPSLYSKKSNHPKASTIEVTDLELNTKTIYTSLRAVSRDLNIQHNIISNYFKRSQIKPYKGRFVFKNLLLDSPVQQIEVAKCPEPVVSYYQAKELKSRILKENRDKCGVYR